MDAPLRLTALAEDGLHLRFWATSVAELRLMVRGHPWWWYGVALGLFIACLATPHGYFHRFFIPLVWLWPMFIWSAMGNQEHRHRTDRLVFSCAHLARRQLPAAWLAGALATAVFAGGVALRFLIAGESHSLFGWFVGILFVPALALALGVWTRSGRTFEMVYSVIWFLGVVSAGRVWPLDFMGRGDKSVAAGVPAYYVLLTALLLAISLVGRRRQTAMAR
jgi:hypothetical protein